MEGESDLALGKQETVRSYCVIRILFRSLQAPDQLYSILCALWATAFVHTYVHILSVHLQLFPPTPMIPSTLEDAVYSLTSQIPTKSWGKEGKWLGKEREL